MAVVKSKSLELAMKILAMPEGPTSKELQKQARGYLRDLPKEEYEQLKVEALTGSSVQDDMSKEELEDYKYKLFRSMVFSNIEASAYCKMRLNAPGVRRVIARRALLIKLNKGKLPRNLTHFELCRMEKERGLEELDHDSIMELLRT